MRGHLIHAGLAVAVCVTGCDRLLGLREFPPGTVTPVDAPATGPLVQQQIFSAPMGPILSGQLPSPPAQGDVLVMVGATTNQRLAMVSGGGVAMWNHGPLSDHETNVEIWYGVVDTTPLPVTIDCISTCTANEEIWMLLTEWSGLQTSNLADGNGGDGTGLATPAAASAATLHAPDLLIFAVSTTGNIGDATDPLGGMWFPLKVIKPSSSVQQAAWYEVAPSSGMHSPQVAVANRWDAVVAGFRM